MNNTIDKKKVMRSFSRHAPDYDQYTELQKRIVKRLAGMIARLYAGQRSILDIGSGTGILLNDLKNCNPSICAVGVDIAHGMNIVAKNRLNGTRPANLVTADADELPFGPEKFDIVTSTSTFQWLNSLDNVFGESRRVLKHGGSFIGALFGSGTLRELHSSYREALREAGIAHLDRTHRFFTTEDVCGSLERAGFHVQQIDVEHDMEQYADVRTFLSVLKKIGAGNASTLALPSHAHLRVISRMCELYEERYEVGGDIPATYEIIYIHALKDF